MLVELEEKSKHWRAVDKEAETMRRRLRNESLSELNEHPANILAAQLLKQIKEPLQSDVLPLLQLTIWWLENKAGPKAHDLTQWAYGLMSQSPFGVAEMFLDDFESFEHDVEELDESQNEEIEDREVDQADSKEEILYNHLTRLLRSMEEQVTPERVGQLLAENLNSFFNLDPT